jgi:hypothetical protein
MSLLTSYLDPDVDAIRSNIDNTFISDFQTNFSKINSPVLMKKQQN